MAKRTFEIQSRQIYLGPEERSISELFSFLLSCEFDDDSEAINDFDVTLLSDAARFSESVAYDTAEEVLAGEKADAITGTRTNDTTFTRTAGTWTVDALLGYRVWAYSNALPDSGSWHDVLDNAATTITVSGTLPAGADRIQLQAKTKIRHSILLNPLPGFYGSFFKYTITKKIAANGLFKVFGVKLEGVPTTLDPEFIAVMGTISKGWET